MPTSDPPLPPSRPGAVQSLDRALRLLTEVAEADGEMKLAEMEAATGLPSPTVHRLVRSLVDNGYLVQQPDRSYALGSALIRVGEVAGRRLGGRAVPRLREVAAATGESANMAVLEHDMVVYVAQSPASRSMRMFTEVGRRVHVHATGVGKAVLAQLSEEDARALLARTGMPPRTEATRTEPEDLLAELDRVRAQGWAADEGEEEDGVRCLAVPVPGAPLPSAISVSAPSGRMPDGRTAEVVSVLQHAATAIGRDLGGPTASPTA